MLDPLDLSDSPLRQVLWTALDSFGNEELFAFCRDHDPILRTAAAKKLHMRPGADVFEESVRFCGDSDPAVREIGCFILAQLGTPLKPYSMDSNRYLQDLASDKAVEVRAAAIAGLGHLSVPSSLPTILMATSDISADVRQSAAFALGSFEGIEVLPTLERLMLDEDLEVREWAEVSIESAKARAMSRQV